MPLELGTTDIKNVKLGTTDVNYVYLGTNLVWSRVVKKTFTDDYNTNTIANYTITGQAVNITGGSIGTGNTTAGERWAIYNQGEMATDDVHIRVVIGTNTNQVTSIIFRCNAARDRFVRMNMINGTSYMQCVSTTGQYHDVGSTATEAFGFTCNTAVGTIIDIYATGDNYRVLRNSVQVFNQNDNRPCAKGVDYRKWGYNFGRSGTTNSPRIDSILIEDQ